MSTVDNSNLLKTKEEKSRTSHAQGGSKDPRSIDPNLLIIWGFLS